MNIENISPHPRPLSQRARGDFKKRLILEHFGKIIEPWRIMGRR
jgi:hypothetical protein